MLCLRCSKDLGEQLADLHLHNKKQLEKLNKEQQTVGKSTTKNRLNSWMLAAIMIYWRACLCRKENRAVRGGCCGKIWLQCGNMLWISTSGSFFLQCIEYTGLPRASVVITALIFVLLSSHLLSPPTMAYTPIQSLFIALKCLLVFALLLSSLGP